MSGNGRVEKTMKNIITVAAVALMGVVNEVAASSGVVYDDAALPD